MPLFIFKKSKVLVAFAIFSIIFQGCIGSSNAPQVTTAGAAVGGGLLGASAGAIAGALISNGDIAKSALLGGALGIPAAIALTLLLNSGSETDPARIDREPIIKANEEKIFQRERDLVTLREQVVGESPDYDFEYSDRGDRIDGAIYNGHTQGNPFR